jgi:hypothetical protein
VAFLLFLSSPLRRPWLEMDNHEILQLYWLGAFTLSRFATRPDEVLRITARWLLGLVFAFAFAWKLLSPDFVDGSALELLFGVETRMAELAVAANAQPADTAVEVWDDLRTWQDPAVDPEPVAYEVGGPVHRWAPTLAWLTVVIEGVVALALLLPLTARWRWLRDATLLVFVLATYPLAPVLPFAWLLLSMGAMQSELSSRTRNRVYIGTFLLITALFGRRDLVLFPLLEWITSG